MKPPTPPTASTAMIPPIAEAVTTERFCSRTMNAKNFSWLDCSLWIARAAALPCSTRWRTRMRLRATMAISMLLTRA